MIDLADVIIIIIIQSENQADIQTGIQVGTQAQKYKRQMDEETVIGFHKAK